MTEAFSPAFCGECGQRPVFVLSDRQPEWPVLLVHENPLCPLRRRVYHKTPRRAIARMHRVLNDGWCGLLLETEG